MLDEEAKLPFTAHLEELRSRLIKCFIAVIVGFVPAYFFKERLFDILNQPLIRVMQDGDTLIFTGVTEAFFTYLKVALFTGLIVSSPYIIYHFWMFVAPGLYKNERRMMGPIILLSAFFFVGGDRSSAELRHGDVVALGQQRQGGAEIDVFDFLDKADDVAAFLAAETMEDLLGGTDFERGGFFLVEGTNTLIFPPALLQRQVGAENLDNVQ